MRLRKEQEIRRNFMKKKACASAGLHMLGLRGRRIGQVGGAPEGFGIPNSDRNPEGIFMKTERAHQQICNCAGCLALRRGRVAKPARTENKNECWSTLAGKRARRSTWTL
jgi:hypothetical protein